MSSYYRTTRNQLASWLLVYAAMLTGLLAGMTGLPLHAQETTKTFQTPQEVFMAARTAIQKENLAGLCECLTDDSRDLLAGGLTVNIVALKRILAGAAGPENKRLLDKIDPILVKHDLTEKAFARIEPFVATFKSNDLSGRLKIVRIVLEPVKERNTFIAEIITALHKNPPKGNTLFGAVKGGATLTDVKFDGDTAQGTVVHKQENGEVRAPMHFRKKADSWKIDLTAELNKAFNPKRTAKAPQPPLKKS